MTQEEKAKAYDEALKYATIYYKEGNEDMKTMMKTCFPVLVEESEGERIRKHLISLFEKFVTLGVANECETSEIKVDDIIAWLEKQGGQKSSEWSEKDEDTLHCIIDALDSLDIRTNTNGEHEDHTEEIYWLKSLKYRVQPQPKREWSEEDRRMLIGLIDELDAIMNKATPNEISVYSKYSNWLNSIKDRFGCKVNCTTTKEWKPSDEQMMALNYVVNLMASSERPTENDLYYNILKSLREQLKKLREE